MKAPYTERALICKSKRFEPSLLKLMEFTIECYKNKEVFYENRIDRSERLCRRGAAEEI